MASDGKGKGEREEGKREKGKGAYELAGVTPTPTPYLALAVTPEFDKRLDASGYDSARARPLLATTSSKSTPPTRPKTEDWIRYISKARMEIPATECRCESCMMQ